MTEIDLPDLSKVPDDALGAMRAAADEMLEIMHAAYRANSNVVWDILRFAPKVEPDRHYPEENAFDPGSGAQYYYHMHRPGEHGHFHCFIMNEGLPEDLEPMADQRLDLRDPAYTARFAHLVAIGMDEFGHPKHLFATNRWVTQEIVYPAETTIALLDRFRIDHTFPAWSTNRWITAAMVLFRPQAEAVIRARDAEYRRLQAAEPDAAICEDRDREILAQQSVDLERQIDAVRQEAARRGL